MNLLLGIRQSGVRQHDERLDGWFRWKERELAPGFAIASDDVFLDVGCGLGYASRFAAYCGAETISTDTDPGAVATTRRRLRGAARSRVLQSNSQPLPLPDGAATRIACLEVLEHVEDPEAFLREILRVGRPGALYLLTVPGALSEALQRDLAPAEYWRAPNHLRVFADGELRSLAEKVGLKPVREFQHGFFYSVWWALFWATPSNLGDQEPRHLRNWTRTWAALLATSEGVRVKRALDGLLPKSCGLVCEKPAG